MSATVIVLSTYAVRDAERVGAYRHHIFDGVAPMTQPQEGLLGEILHITPDVLAKVVRYHRGKTPHELCPGAAVARSPSLEQLGLELLLTRLGGAVHVVSGSVVISHGGILKFFAGDV